MTTSLWKLRRLGRSRVLHRLISGIARAVYAEGTVRRIPFGPLAGRRFYCSSGVQFWMPLGLYEMETCQWLEANLEAGDCFYDVGANVGYFSLLGSSLVGAEGTVVAVEPVASSALAVKKQILVNNLPNVQVIRCALLDESGTGSIVVERNVANSHLSSQPLAHAPSRPERSEEVELVTLDELRQRVGREPNLIKIDVEGAEARVLQGARETLTTHSVALLISTHSAKLRQSCTGILEECGYRVSRLRGFEHELVASPD